MSEDEAEVIRRAMSILGSRTSERKKLSSVRNAKRPRRKRKSNPLAKIVPTVQDQAK